MVQVVFGGGGYAPFSNVQDPVLRCTCKQISISSPHFSTRICATGIRVLLFPILASVVSSIETCWLCDSSSLAFDNDCKGNNVDTTAILNSHGSSWTTICTNGCAVSIAEHVCYAREVIKLHVFVYGVGKRGGLASVNPALPYNFSYNSRC